MKKPTSKNRFKPVLLFFTLLIIFFVYIKHQEIVLSYCIQQARIAFPNIRGAVTEDQMAIKSNCESKLTLSDVLQLWIESKH